MGCIGFIGCIDQAKFPLAAVTALFGLSEVLMSLPDWHTKDRQGKA